MWDLHSRADGNRAHLRKWIDWPTSHGHCSPSVLHGLWAEELLGTKAHTNSKEGECSMNVWKKKGFNLLLCTCACVQSNKSLNVSLHDKKTALSYCLLHVSACLLYCSILFHSLFILLFNIVSVCFTIQFCFSTFLQCKAMVLEKAEQIGRLQKEVGMKIPVEDYKEEFHFGLMEVAFEWARGMVSSSRGMVCVFGWKK